MAMTRDCKSLGFGLRRFESYFQHHDPDGSFFTDSFFESSPTSSTIFVSQKCSKCADFVERKESEGDRTDDAAVGDGAEAVAGVP